MIRGPFHAVVSKSRFVMDIFLEEPKTGRMIFVRRFRVGVGKDGSTPTGQWRVVRGCKKEKADWTPPASSNLERKLIEWGEPGYPFGAKGYWISLEGTGKTPYTREDGYGIHGTNDPSSIGKASSLGCIRLGNNDIEMLFAMLYDKGKWSTVTILP
ncbi:MAG: L,D-transpeptidase [Phycisphaerae bacterium]|nr:L,D-transpeptidase [Phycisphaerae bacterium]